MRRRWLITLLLAPLLLAVVALAVYRCHTVPLSQCSEVYRQYRDMPGIQASFVKDKQINDTLFLDMTLFEAEDSAAFANLLRAFGHGEEYIRDMATLREMFAGKADALKASFTGYCLRGRPSVEGAADPAENEVISYFPVALCVAIYHTHSGDEIHAVLRKGYWGEINIHSK